MAIPIALAIGAMIAGTAMQQQAQSQAARRQRRLTQESLSRQQGYQREAEQAALAKAQEFNTDDRAAEQDRIEQQITENLMQPVQQAQAARPEAPSVQGNLSSDYTLGQARQSAESLRSAEALARLFGKATGAGRLRQNEAIGLADTGQFIDRLGNFARGQYSADQVGIQRAGQPSGGMMLGGTLLQGVGMMGAMGALGGAAGAGSAGGAAASSGVWAPAGGTIGGSALPSLGGLSYAGSGGLVGGSALGSLGGLTAPAALYRLPRL